MGGPPGQAHRQLCNQPRLPDLLPHYNQHIIYQERVIDLRERLTFTICITSTSCMENVRIFIQEETKVSLIHTLEI